MSGTTVGNYFVSNYPPFSVWSPDEIASAEAVLARTPPPGDTLGLYVHIPFCRKRCDFCYFKVYTDRGAGEIRRYLDAVVAELARYAETPWVRGRSPRFVYFGGGTPSYLSTDQLEQLFDGLRAVLPWDAAEEIAFECEPGTLQEHKLALLRDQGVTRLSLGIENFDAEILELNNRAHRTDEIFRAYEWARGVGFDQINVDLIAGMVGETDANWARCVEETVKLRPESVTIYQLEVPYNTTIFRRMKDSGASVAPVADWETKRRWTDEAFARLEEVGYHMGSAYTACLGDDVRFLYRDALWFGAGMLGVGVSSFSHLGGVHFQNEHAIEPYVQRALAGELPLARAHALTDEERLIREFVLQLKLGRLETSYFRDKFGVDVTARFAATLRRHQAEGWLAVEPDAIRVTRAGLLRVDGLLHDYFLEEHRGARYA